MNFVLTSFSTQKKIQVQKKNTYNENTFQYFVEKNFPLLKEGYYSIIYINNSKTKLKSFFKQDLGSISPHDLQELIYLCLDNQKYGKRITDIKIASFFNIELEDFFHLKKNYLNKDSNEEIKKQKIDKIEEDKIEDVKDYVDFLLQEKNSIDNFSYDQTITDQDMELFFATDHVLQYYQEEELRDQESHKKSINLFPSEPRELKVPQIKSKEQENFLLFNDHFSSNVSEFFRDFPLNHHEDVLNYDALFAIKSPLFSESIEKSFESIKDSLKIIEKNYLTCLRENLK